MLDLPGPKVLMGPPDFREEEDLLDLRAPLEKKELTGILDPWVQLAREADQVSMEDRECPEI